MNVIMDEKEYTRGLVESPRLGAKPSETLTYIAMYYKDLKYPKAQTRRLLEEYLLKCDTSVNLVKWQELIDGTIKRAAKREFIQVDGVPITQKEIDTCVGLGSVRMQRLMFALICFAKFANMANANNNNWVNREDKEVFKTANVTVSAKEQSLMLNDLKNAKLIRFSKKVDNLNINVTCLDNDGDPVLIITDFRNLGYQFMKYQEGKLPKMRLASDASQYTECEECGLVIKKVNNRQKYCTACGEDIHRRRARELYHYNIPQ